MRLPTSAHTSRPWRIHEFTHDFRVEDVWALPTPGGVHDFHRLVQVVTSLDPSTQGPWVVRTLFAIRWKLGTLFGWDGRHAGHRPTRTTLRDRLPVDLQQAPTGPDTGPFTPLYLLDDEWAAEVVNKTVHGVIHLGWVPDPSGGYRGQMAVLVKRNGLLGIGYMTAIKPFRYLLVYPLMTREFGRAWRALADDPSFSAGTASERTRREGLRPIPELRTRRRRTL